MDLDCFMMNVDIEFICEYEGHYVFRYQHEDYHRIWVFDVEGNTVCD